MTVSKALRGEKKVAAATRERILKEAERIGYRPDPVTSRLMARLRWRREGSEEAGSVIGWLDAVGTQPYSEKQAFRQRLLEGAEARARRMGYRVERFPLEEENVTAARLKTILKSRGIEAVVVPPLPAGKRSSAFDFSAFACAAVGFSLESPRINRVAFNEFSAVTRCLIEAKEQGFLRPGLCYSMSQDQPVVRQALGAWHGFFALDGEGSGVPPLIAERISPEAYGEWLESHGPDVVIANANLEEKKGPPVISFVLEAGTSDKPGMVRDWAVLGAAVVDMVVAQLQRNETGCGEDRKTMLLGGSWKGNK